MSFHELKKDNSQSEEWPLRRVIKVTPVNNPFGELHYTERVKINCGHVMLQVEDATNNHWFESGDEIRCRTCYIEKKLS